MAGACDFLSPFSFWAAIISCLLRSASSSAFFFARSSASFFSAASLRSFSSSALFCWASFFSCSILTSFLLACFSFSLLSPPLPLPFHPSTGGCTPSAGHSARPSWLCLLLFLCPFIPPLVDVLLQLVIQLAFLGFVFSSSFALSSLHWWMYSFSWSFSSPFLALSSPLPLP